MPQSVWEFCLFICKINFLKCAVLVVLKYRTVTYGLTISLHISALSRNNVNGLMMNSVSAILNQKTIIQSSQQVWSRRSCQSGLNPGWLGYAAGTKVRRSSANKDGDPGSPQAKLSKQESKSVELFIE